MYMICRVGFYFKETKLKCQTTLLESIWIAYAYRKSRNSISTTKSKLEDLSNHQKQIIRESGIIFCVFEGKGNKM